MNRTADSNRFRWLYEPSGPAAEYAPLAGNFRRGCGHGCHYCYCPQIMRMTPAEFHQPDAPMLKKFTLKNAEHDLRLMAEAGDTRPVHLCFIGDPFDRTRYEQSPIMYPLLRLFAEYSIRPQILTKNGLNAVAAYGEELQAAEAIFGQTIIFTAEQAREKWEPGACKLEARWQAFTGAHADGLHTWLSVEPVIAPEQTLIVIGRAIESGTVDEIRVGKWNHDERANEIAWPDFADDAWHLLINRHENWVFKRDLAEHMLPGVTVKRDGDRLWGREELYPEIGGIDDDTG